MIEKLGEVDKSVPLVGSFIAVMGSASGLVDVLLHSALEWYPVIAVTATKIAPEVPAIPAEAFDHLLFALAIVVVFWRGSKAVRSTYERFRE